MNSGLPFPQLFGFVLPCNLPLKHVWVPVLLCSSCAGMLSLLTPLSSPGSGWIAALSEVHGNLAVAVIMMVVAAFFTLCAVLSLFLLKQVSASGASRAQAAPRGLGLTPPFTHLKGMMMGSGHWWVKVLIKVVLLVLPASMPNFLDTLEVGSSLPLES